MITVTDHAVARYAQRALRIAPESLSDDVALDVIGDTWRDEIRLRIRAIVRDAVALGCTQLTCGGLTYILRGTAVVTVSRSSNEIDINALPGRLAMLAAARARQECRT